MHESSSAGGRRLNEHAENLILREFLAAIDFSVNNAGASSTYFLKEFACKLK